LRALVAAEAPREQPDCQRSPSLGAGHGQRRPVRPRRHSGSV